MTARVFLRVAAIAIVLGGIADPTFTRELPVRQSFTIVSKNDMALSGARRL